MVITDEGPQFSSEEFTNLANDCTGFPQPIEQESGSNSKKGFGQCPGFPKPIVNEKAQATVKIVKKIMKIQREKKVIAWGMEKG